MNDLNQNEYLEHFGVKGMKWGVRKSKDQVAREQQRKLDKYKTKESDMVSKRLAKTGAKLKNATEKGSAKKMAKYTIRKANLQRELKAISKMSYNDMKAEKIAVGRAWVEHSVAMNTAIALMGYPAIYAAIPDTAAIKQRRRLKSVS